MATFKVISIIDGDTFEVSPQWKWNGQTGTRVRPTGYNAPELSACALHADRHTYGGQAAREKLSRLILGEEVDLHTAHKVDRGRLVCDVYYKGKYLAGYFPEYK